MSRCTPTTAPRAPRAIPAMTSRTPAAVALREALATAFALAHANVDGVVEGTDPLPLHDFRVAIRIQRALLGAFRDLVAPATLATLKTHLRRFAKATGGLRDLDVLLEARTDLEALLPTRWRPQLEPVFAQLARRRDAEQRRVARRFRSPVHRRAWATVRQHIDALCPQPAPSGTTARAAAVAALERRRRKLEKLARQLRRGGSGSELHALRIAGKKLRYVVESFQNALPRSAVGSVLRQLKSAQGVLGRTHDRDVHAAALVAAAAALPQCRDAVDRLASTLRRQQADAQPEVAAAVASLLSPRFRRRLDELSARR